MKIVRLGIVAALASAFWYGIQQARQTADGFSYKIIGFGVPKINSGIASLPVVIRFANPTQFTLPVQKLTVELSYLKGTEFVKGGHLVYENFQVNPGSNDFTVYPELDLRALLQNLFSTIQTILTNRTIDVRANLTLLVKGVETSQVFEKTIPING